MTILTKFGALTLAVMVPTGAALADGMDKLRPHRAVYDLQLKKASDRSGISGMSGRIVYEMTGSRCEGFATRFRFLTDVRTRSKNFTNDQRTTSYESADGKSFSFVTQSFLNGQLEQDLRGEAKSTPSAIEVKITKPEEQEVELEPALFMTQHIGQMIEAARNGQTFFTAKVFDGSEGGDQLVDTTAVIGKKKPDVTSIEGEEEKLAKAFSGETAWPVSVSYFSTAPSQDQSEKVPIYSVSFLMHESGVSRDLTMRYADYSLKADLKQIEYLKVDECK